MKMKYALVNGERQEVQPGFIGKCQCCNCTVIAKCGNVRIRHWSHKEKLNCDQWWEETEWHRRWKESFPKDWQEIVRFAENGEKHIADVMTDQGYVIEFQHSPIKFEERKNRENFYKKMIWIVDGSRRLKDKDTFLNVWEYSQLIDSRKDLRKLQGAINKCALLRDWGNSSVPVFFDFGEHTLFGLLPKTKESVVHGCSVERNRLIASLYPSTEMNNFETLLKGWAHLIANEERYLLWQSKGFPPMRR
jgi:competence protein CoiA